MTELFSMMPDSARIWINPTDRNLSDEEQKRILDSLSDFVAKWSSHGRQVVAETAIVADRFVVTAAHVPGGDVSGCGIDASVHALDGVAETMRFGWAAALDVFYRKEGTVHQVDRATFSALASQGSVTPETMVFDTSLSTVAEWRQGRFELPARRSWHDRVFRFETETA